MEAPATKKNVDAEKNYWQSFYAKFSVSKPSQFCVMTAIELEQDRPIIEFGCGNARDSRYFASQGYNVFGCDICKDAISKNADNAKGMENLHFQVVDASDSGQVQGVINQARALAGGGQLTVYSRFFLHSIDETQEEKFLHALSPSMTAGDKFYFEFRCLEDEALEKVHGKGHYRRYIDTQALIQGISELGFDTTYDVTGRGMAKYKEEDPFVSRIIAQKR
eukprot:CAMPEP_0197439098 /NCGR_PEP_ID=MMETSP1175-20131217/5909_1 /TAXON_ID=1003142 /ORGANISM="Triceratium dubium, Strain CCMP147" /LENGTH=220 /DNA_ID=CAMNT_0042968935 /DNA_START=210 /DNA_END=872 /DNA_ORIENTATION=+